MFVHLNNETTIAEALKEYPNEQSIVIFKNVQSGKTADVLELIETTYKTSATIFISDKNSALAEQTNGRAIKKGWKVENFRSGNIAKLLKDGIGKKQISHFMMEINNLEMLETAIELLETLPVTVIVDEGDKNRNSEGAKAKKTAASEEEEEEIEEEENNLPKITELIFKIKNHIKGRENSKVVFVSATPQGILCSEKDNWLVFYKDPYLNYTGIGLNHPANIKINPAISYNYCKSRDRWTGNAEDKYRNTFRLPLISAISTLESLETKDSTVKQLMLVSLENINAAQHRMAKTIDDNIINKEEVDLIIFNGLTRKKDETLADMIKVSSKKKIIIVSGYMASRGVSFTDFSDPDNKFELVVQIHYTKPSYPLNSSLQNMRVFGPARRTVSRPAIVCNQVCQEDLHTNFLESYRIIKEIASGNLYPEMGRYNKSRPLSQAYNFRYLKRGSDKFAVFVSNNLDDHLPIV